MGRKSLASLRQKEIVKAFYKVAKKEGLENASIAKVAKEMDVNPSLVMHYFKSKQELIHGLIEHTLEQYKLIYNPDNGVVNPREKLKKTILNLFSHKWDKLFDDGVFYSCFSLTFRDKKIKQHFRVLHDHLRLMLSDALTVAKENGVIKVEDVGKTSDFIFVLIEGAYYYLSMVSDRVEYEKRLKHYQHYVLQILGLK
jgi:AcrR family transcriptional regulator